MGKIVEEITEQEKMTAIAGLRADMLTQYNWQKRMLHQIRLVSIGTAFTLLICLSISVYLVFRPDSASEIDLKYIKSQNLLLEQREIGIRTDRFLLMKRDSMLLIREKIQNIKDSTYFTQ